MQQLNSNLVGFNYIPQNLGWSLDLNMKNNSPEEFKKAESADFTSFIIS